MKTLEELIRPNIQNLKPYSSARDEYKGSDGIFLDANENPFGELNRYPDPYQKKLKSKLSELNTVSADSIFVGNGSDEVIELAFRIFCTPGKDKALTFSPTYGMYEVSAAINDVELIKVPLNSEFQIDFELTKPFLKDPSLKLIFICSPNNPTGNSIDGIEEILKSFNGIVIVDEAYIDFSEKESWLKRLNEFPNLIISQTFSKAWGLAAARVGLAYANPELVTLV
jgi:histidinol-phosphate aminotransferase